jgi:cytochrome c-type biogenesis protein CcmE
MFTKFTAYQWKRFKGVATTLFLAILGVVIILYTFNDNLLFFYTPSQLEPKAQAINGKEIRLGGLVKEGSYHKEGSNIHYFIVHDNNAEKAVRFIGILPNLFKEGQGIIATGRFYINESIFDTKEILAKHDENYIPREVYEEMKKASQK